MEEQPTLSPQPTPPAPDPLIDEVRAIREALFAAHDYDLEKFAAHLKTIEDQYRSRIVKTTADTPCVTNNSSTRTCNASSKSNDIALRISARQSINVASLFSTDKVASITDYCGHEPPTNPSAREWAR